MVRWNPSDEESGFTIIDTGEFKKQILPKYFKHINMESFIRQLNTYEFHKNNRRQKEYKVYYNANFR